MDAFLFCIAIYAANFPQGERACEQAELILKYSEKYSVDPTVITSLIYWESGYFPNRVSEVGACGLTQVIPRWTGPVLDKTYRCKDLKDPETSIKVGTQILALHLQRSKGNYNQALCFYNQGLRGCNSRVVKNRGTKYSRRIMKLSKKLKSKLEKDPCRLKNKKDKNIVY